MKRYLPLLLLVLGQSAIAEPRIQQLQRCGDLLSEASQHWCLRAQGLEHQAPQVWLGDRALPANAVLREGDRLEFTLDQPGPSAPLWLQVGGQKSNPVWLTRQRSHVVAAGPHEVARNMDGLTTYLDLVSLLIEEKHNGREEAQHIADKYGAQVVGAIPPLNVYQLRLPVRDLVQRDAMILRMGSELSVDAVIVEESAPERGEEGEGGKGGKATVIDQADEWAANRFTDALYYYQRRVPASNVPVQPIRVGVIERELDFDAAPFQAYRGACGPRQACLYGRDGARAQSHGSHVAGILAGHGEGVAGGFLSGLGKASPGFEVIVERNSDAGITANIAASVNLVEDGVRVLNWSWGIHRVGARSVEGDEVDSLVRSGLAMSGYEELLEEFFLWLRSEHPDVVVVNSAGNGSSWSGTDEYRLPSSFVTEQLLVVGGHQRSERDTAVEDPQHVVKRRSSNVDMRVDVSAAACLQPADAGKPHCGTSYATPLVASTVAAMLSINPQLTPEQVRMLLRRSALTMGSEQDFEAMDAEDLTAPILPSERNGRLNDPDLGRSARLDMQRALDLAVQSRERVR